MTRTNASSFLSMGTAGGMTSESDLLSHENDQSHRKESTASATSTAPDTRAHRIRAPSEKSKSSRSQPKGSGHNSRKTQSKNIEFNGKLPGIMETSQSHVNSSNNNNNNGNNSNYNSDTENKDDHKDQMGRMSVNVSAAQSSDHTSRRRTTGPPMISLVLFEFSNVLLTNSLYAPL